MNLQPLVAEQLPLTGKHLIEASAGTGKTFNITRIYLRLLLEKELTVEQILVMTFTKDATEEIRSRIGKTLRETIANWDELVQKEPFYQALAHKISKQDAFVRLNRALLFLDDAAIFTIHGFCKRVLSQYAFDSGLLFNMQMESGCQEQMLEAVQDWYRLIAKQTPEDYLAVAEIWPEPTSFLQVFANAFDRKKEILAPNEQAIIEEFSNKAKMASACLVNNQPFLFEALVDNQKGAKKEERVNEYEQLISWLSLARDVSAPTEVDRLAANFPGAFCDGRRYSRAKQKAQLTDIFAPVNEIKFAWAELDNKLSKAKAYQVVLKGIDKINQLIEDKKQIRSLLSFDDLIAVLAEQLSSESGRNLAAQLYQQYPAAMIDEFQDTDPNQFEILTAIYHNQNSGCLFLIGDPKQAIYGFRGGDIFTYLAARSICDYQWVMDTNWRSTAQMIEGYNRLFYGDELSSNGKITFGHDIPYHPVKPSSKISYIDYADTDKALQFIYFENEQGKKVKPAFRPVMANWLANKVIQLLNDNNGNVSAADIAILVRDGTEANVIKEALEAKQLASVYLSNRSNLWLTPQASQLLLVLKGILFYEQDRYFNAALASGLLGYRDDSLTALQQDELAWQEIKFAFKELRTEWEYKGFISSALKLLHQHISIPIENKERVLTNLMHLVELLQSASKRHHQPLELLHWFEQQVQLDVADNEAELRLESDEHLIKIVTQHGSKGLEYPIVFVPFASRYKNPKMVGNRKVTVVDYHDELGQSKTILEGSDIEQNQMAEEAYAESVRLLYVAVTRAVQRCYIMVADFEQYHQSPLGKTLHWQSDTSIYEDLSTLSAQYPSSIAVDCVYEQELEQFQLRSAVNELEHELSAATFNGNIERDWWLSSFTALSRNLRHGGVSLPDRDSHEVVKSSSVIPSSDIRFDLAKGAQSGNLLHDLLEYTNFSLWDWHETASKLQGKYANVLEGWRSDELVSWLEQISAAELSPSLMLKSLDESNVLKEQEFYFPMQQASSQKLATLLYQHRKRIAPNLQASAVKLPAYQQLKGMMHGFIDLIFEFEGKYFVCDYKSTHLGDEFSHYHAEHLQQNIVKNYYDLQYLLYSLALHRLLQSRLPNYEVSQHFGGVYYLYLRGMKPGKEAGVFYTDITELELDGLDALFKGKPNGEANE